MYVILRGLIDLYLIILTSESIRQDAMNECKVIQFYTHLLVLSQFVIWKTWYNLFYRCTYGTSRRYRTKASHHHVKHANCYWILAHVIAG